MTDGGSLAIYAAMTQSLDRGIGRALEALERSRLERDTLVIFTSDNGGERYSYQWPFSFQKSYLREGGIRVPAIVRWPASYWPIARPISRPSRWTGPRRCSPWREPSADAAFPIDGQNVTPLLKNPSLRHERSLFWRSRAADAARVGDWKYPEGSTAEYLSDLAVDPGE